MCTPRLPVVDWTEATANLNGLVRFAERSLVSARVPSHFKSSLSWLLCLLNGRDCACSEFVLIDCGVWRLFVPEDGFWFEVSLGTSRRGLFLEQVFRRMNTLSLCYFTLSATECWHKRTPSNYVPLRSANFHVQEYHFKGHNSRLQTWQDFYRQTM